jgi:CelD/BcsL family acetyltransferase involved in cellulose biosynthesis
LSRSYVVEEVTNTDDLLNLREEWNKLVFEDPYSTIFQTWEWNFNVWEYERAGTKGLNVLLVRDEGGDLAGIAPFYSYEKIIFGLKIRIIELIGKNFTDYRGFIVRSEDDLKIYTKILSWLYEDSINWDVVYLHYVSEESPLVRNFDTLLRGLNFRTVIQQHNVCPYIALYPSRNFDENLGDRTIVKYLKRKTRKLEKDLNYELLKIGSLSELDEHLEKLFELHKKRRRQMVQIGIFNSEDQEKFFKNLSHSLLERGWLKLLFLLVNNRPAACLYNFEFKNKVYFYQSGLETDPKFAPYSLGYVIHSFAIQEALKEGMQEYDFLSGNEDYKKDWTAIYRSLYRIKIVPLSSKKAIFFNANERLFDFCRNSKFYRNKTVRKFYFLLKSLEKKLWGGNSGVRRE